MPKLCDNQDGNIAVKGRLFIVENSNLKQIRLCKECRKKLLTGRNDYSKTSTSGTYSVTTIRRSGSS